jgi:hypothetical protein
VEDIAAARGASIAAPACDPIGDCAMLQQKTQHRTSSSMLRGPRRTDRFEPPTLIIARPPPTRGNNMQYLTPTPATGYTNTQTAEYRRTLGNLCDKGSGNQLEAPLPETKNRMPQ